MDRDSIIQKFQKLNVWKRGGKRAAHKPLLVLYAIGKLLRGESRLISFKNSEDHLKDLLKEFGPWKSNHLRPQYPFWRLRNETKKTKSGRYLTKTKYKKVKEKTENRLGMPS